MWLDERILITTIIGGVVSGLLVSAITTGWLCRFPRNTYRRIFFRCARQNRIQLRVQVSKKIQDADTERVDIFRGWVRPDDYISMEVDYERYDCLTFEGSVARLHKHGGKFVVFEDNVGISNISFPHGRPSYRIFERTYYYDTPAELSVARFGDGPTLSVRFRLPGE